MKIELVVIYETAFGLQILGHFYSTITCKEWLQAHKQMLIDKGYDLERVKIFEETPATALSF